jgi:hypothetical protein
VIVHYSSTTRNSEVIAGFASGNMHLAFDFASLKARNGEEDILYLYTVNIQVPFVLFAPED